MTLSGNKFFTENTAGNVYMYYNPSFSQGAAAVDSATSNVSNGFGTLFGGSYLTPQIPMLAGLNLINPEQFNG